MPPHYTSKGLHAGCGGLCSEENEIAPGRLLT